MTNQERYELTGYAKSLFAQCKWTDDQWEAFADAFQYQPFDVVKQAVKQHFQETRFITPTTGAVVNLCKTIRFGELKAQGQRTVERTPDQIVAELRWCWEKASAMYQADHAIRLFASRDGTRAANELLGHGWTRDQVDVVIQEVTGGQVADSFRDHQRRLQSTWDDRVGCLVNRLSRQAASRPLDGALPRAMRESASGDRPVELPGDRSASGTACPLGRVPGDSGATIESQEDNDLAPGTFINTDEDEPLF